MRSELRDTELRAPRAGDFNAILKAWISNWLGSWYAGCLPYDLHQDAYRRSLIERVIPVSEIVVACDVEVKDLIRGWICYGRERSPATGSKRLPPVVHYVYVVERHQRKGLAARLMRETIGDPLSPFYVTHRTKDWNAAAARARWNFQWRPTIIRFEEEYRERTKDAVTARR